MIELQNIRKEFGELTAVNDLTTKIENGELVTLVGPSGSGKSTVLNMLAGHLEPTSGSILLNDTDITELTPQERPTSMVFQSWALFPHMTVRENVRFPMEAQGISDDDRVDSLLKLVQLDPAEYAEKQANELSGGEQQRVALARSIAYDPDILLLDEPLGSLDYVLQKQLRRELTELNRELDMTFIYVTHSLESALIMSDRIFVLNGGELIQSGSPIELYQKPVNRFIAEFMGDANLFSVDSITPTDGSIKLTAQEFEDPITFTEPQQIDPDYLVVRYDDATVASELHRDLGVSVKIENKLVKGNRILVEMRSIETDNEYIADIEYGEGADLNRGDTVYFQWNKKDTILIPE